MTIRRIPNANNEMTKAHDESIVVCSTSGRVHSAQDGAIQSILTYPIPDHAGDYVQPDGGALSLPTYHKPFPLSRYGPLVNWIHTIPIGRGEVTIKSLVYEGEMTPVKVGRTIFAQSAADLEGLDLRRRDPRTHRSWDKEPPYTTDECLRAAAQAEALIRSNTAIGVSIEFDAPKERKDIDWWDLPDESLLDNRPARHFNRYEFLAYAHARHPVNPGCLTLGNDEAETLEKAIRIAQTGRLPGGEVCCPVILKAFDDLKGYRGKAYIHVPALPTVSPSQAGAIARSSSLTPGQPSAERTTNKHKGTDISDNSAVVVKSEVRRHLKSIGFKGKKLKSGNTSHKKGGHHVVVDHKGGWTHFHPDGSDHEGEGHHDLKKHLEKHLKGIDMSNNAVVVKSDNYHPTHGDGNGNHHVAFEHHDGSRHEYHVQAKDHIEAEEVALHKHWGKGHKSRDIHKVHVNKRHVQTLHRKGIKMKKTAAIVKSDDTPSSQEKKGSQPGVGVRALLNFVQTLMDACSNLESEGGQSDSMPIRKLCKKLCGKAKALAEDAKGRAETHKAKLDGEEGGKDVDDDDLEMSAERKAIELDADGVVVLKAFDGWKPRRYTAKNIVETPEPAPTPTVIPEDEEAKALKERMRKAVGDAGTLVAAGIANGRL